MSKQNSKSLETTNVKGNVPERSGNSEKLPNTNESNVSNKITDGIIRAFIVKRRKALIDQEDLKSDIVSYETSEGRIINLISFSAIIFCLLLNIMVLHTGCVSKICTL